MKYAPSVGMKFNEDGSVRRFPGNTFLCHLDQSLALIQELKWAQQQLKEMNCGYKFSFLPIESMHQTIFEGVCDQIRKPESWTKHVATDAPLKETTDFFLNALQSVTPQGGYNMVFDHTYNCPIGGTAICIRPQSPSDESAIWDTREALSAATGIRMPNFHEYRFHITLSYRIIELEEADRIELEETAKRIDERLSTTFGVLTHGPVEFCTFEDMFKFTPITRLKA
ncbi:DUF1868 domain-containing protein [Vibrio sp.]|nr:DUF1868 domain-containing protein [Vibrio sp.]